MEIIQNTNKTTKREFQTRGSNCSQGRCYYNRYLLVVGSFDSPRQNWESKSRVELIEPIPVQADESPGELLDSGSGIDITLNTEAGQAREPDKE